MTPLAIRALLGLEPNEVATALLTIEAGATVLRVCNNNEPVISGGENFADYPFNITLPSDGEGIPSADLQIANVDNEISEAMDALGSSPLCKIEVVLASTPDVIEMSFSHLKMRGVKQDDISISATLSQSQIDNRPYPPLRVTQRDFPGLY